MINNQHHQWHSATGEYQSFDLPSQQPPPLLPSLILHGHCSKKSRENGFWIHNYFGGLSSSSFIICWIFSQLLVPIVPCSPPSKLVIAIIFITTKLLIIMIIIVILLIKVPPSGRLKATLFRNHWIFAGGRAPVALQARDTFAVIVMIVIVMVAMMVNKDIVRWWGRLWQRGVLPFQEN